MTLRVEHPAQMLNDREAVTSVRSTSSSFPRSAWERLLDRSAVPRLKDRRAVKTERSHAERGNEVGNAERWNESRVQRRFLLLSFSVLTDIFVFRDLIQLL